MAKLEERIQELSPDQRREVEDFVEFLLQKKRLEKSARKLRMDWAGALSEFRDQYTSLELQKKANDWRLGLD